jgi:hypothetical protein
MQSNKYTININSAGALAADAVFAFQIRGAATLLEISACTSNDSDLTIQVGTSADPDGIMTAVAVGDSETPTVFGRDDWTGALYTDTGNVNYLHFADNTIFEVAVDYDGASGTAGENLMITFWFDEA